MKNTWRKIEEDTEYYWQLNDTVLSESNKCHIMV